MKKISKLYQVDKKAIAKPVGRSITKRIYRNLESKLKDSRKR